MPEKKMKRKGKRRKMKKKTCHLWGGDRERRFSLAFCCCICMGLLLTRHLIWADSCLPSLSLCPILPWNLAFSNLSQCSLGHGMGGTSCLCFNILTRTQHLPSLLCLPLHASPCLPCTLRQNSHPPSSMLALRRERGRKHLPLGEEGDMRRARRNLMRWHAGQQQALLLLLGQPRTCARTAHTLHRTVVSRREEHSLENPPHAGAPTSLPTGREGGGKCPWKKENCVPHSPYPGVVVVT